MGKKSRMPRDTTGWAFRPEHAGYSRGNGFALTRRPDGAIVPAELPPPLPPDYWQQKHRLRSLAGTKAGRKALAAQSAAAELPAKPARRRQRRRRVRPNERQGAAFSPLQVLRSDGWQRVGAEPRCQNCGCYGPARGNPGFPEQGRCALTERPQIPDGVCLQWRPRLVASSASMR